MAQWPDAHPDDLDAPSQAAYGRSFAAAADAAAQDIVTGRLPDLASVWQRATQWRVQQLPPDDEWTAGQMQQRRVFRPLHAAKDYTVIDGRYGYVIPRVGGSPATRCRIRPAGRADVVLLQLDTRATLGGREVALTSIQVPCKAGTGPGAPEPVRAGRWLLPMIVHTDPKLLDEILAHVQHLAAQLRVPTALADKIEGLGAMHWWLAQAMPDKRGSAAKAEFCVRAYAGAAGVALPPFRIGAVPDIEAFLTPLEAYRAQYGAYFTRPPVPVEPPAGTQAPGC